jgi:serine/threonine protein kinase
VWRVTTTETGQVGHYRRQRRLGEGGLGVVHLATGSDGRLVAVKVLRPGVVSGERGRERFVREVRALRRVRGPRVAEVLDADLIAAEPYVVTRHVERRSLDRVVDDHGALRPEAQRRLAAWAGRRHCRRGG